MRSRRVRRNVRRDGFVFPSPLLAVLLIIAGLALGYLWLAGRCQAMAQQIKKMEEQLERLREERKVEEFRWWSQSSPEKIVYALRRRGWRMDWPRDSQVFYVELESNGQAGAEELVWQRRRMVMNE